MQTRDKLDSTGKLSTHCLALFGWRWGSGLLSGRRVLLVVSLGIAFADTKLVEVLLPIALLQFFEPLHHALDLFSPPISLSQKGNRLAWDAARANSHEGKSKACCACCCLQQHARYIGDGAKQASSCPMQKQISVQCIAVQRCLHETGC